MKHSKSTDLGILQTEAENAARSLKSARTTLTNAKQTVDRAEEAHSVAQKALSLGVEQIKTSTKVG